MKIGVCAKVTPDTDTRIKISPEATGIVPAGIKWIVSPYDSFAIEAAVQTKESLGGEVVLFSAGVAKTTTTALRGGGLAVGADSLTLFSEDEVLNTDASGLAKTFAAAIKAAEIELLFCGKQAIDSDNVQVPAMIAEYLGWTQVSMVSEFSVEGTTFTATRNVGGGVQEVVTGSLPAVITADKGLNTPRYAKLPAIMKAKRKKVNKTTIADLGLSADDIAPAAITSAYGMPAARTSGRILEGDVQDQVKELVRLLREEAKVI